MKCAYSSFCFFGYLTRTYQSTQPHKFAVDSENLNSLHFLFI